MSLARATDPDTSHAAADSLDPDALRESQGAILGLLVERARTDPDLLDAYLAEVGPISPSGCRTRRAELVDLGLVRDSGTRARLASGRWAIVWEAPEPRA